MTLPLLFPQEFTLGYLGKLRQFLNLRSNFKAVDALRGRFEIGEKNRPPNIYLLASAAGKSVEDVVAEHTLTPLSRAFTVHDVNDTVARGLNRRQLRYYGQRIGSPLPQYCADCIAEDIEFLGLSYWRRYHLIRGVDYCLKHREALLVRVNSKNLFSFCPQQYALNAHITHQAPHVIPPHPFTKRYADICSGLLDMRRPPGKWALARVLELRLRDFLRFTYEGNSTLLFDMLVKQSPPEWLERHFPDFTSSQQQLTFDRRCMNENQSVAAEKVVLLLAALFDSATEALSAIHTMVEDRSANKFSNRIARAQRDKILWESSESIDSDVDGGFHVEAVAEKFELPLQATRELLRRAGLPGLQMALRTKAGEVPSASLPTAIKILRA